ncbi:MAG: CoA transferase [Magnetovibrio sp.]|nr:CoA transferase [Magnetovibrio sp.]
MAEVPELPLSGLRVLDLTTTLAGPYASQILGDFGADVIKIEAPGGDGIRDAGPARNPGMSAVFLGLNRNKRSVELDLKSKPARQALWRLVDGADVFLHAIRPQKIAALSFSPDAVMARKPDIVYGALHGYREDGPYGGRPAYDDVVQGEAGITATFAARDGAPAMVPSSFVDKSTGLITANGLLAAVVRRLRTGRGVYLEVGMLEAMVAYNLVEHLYGRTFVPAEGSAGYERAVSPYRRPHATKDGHLCMLPYTDKQWRSFWAVAGKPELADDPRYATMKARSRNIDDLYRTAGEMLAGRTTADWLAAFGAADIPAGRVNDFDDLFVDPHLRAIDFFRTYDHPSEGPIVTPDTPYRVDGKSLPVHRPHPKLGEHTREVLSEAGLSDAEIDAIIQPAREVSN